MVSQSALDKRVLAYGKVQGTEKTFMPLRVDASGQLVVPYSVPAAEELAIVNGSITPTLPTGLYAHVVLSGEGGAADDLTTIVAPASWIGKRIVIIIKSNTMPITLKHNTELITKLDWVESSIYDVAEYECIGVNTWRLNFRSDNE
jgi:hypothetical protein